MLLFAPISLLFFRKIFTFLDVTFYPPKYQISGVNTVEKNVIFCIFLCENSELSGD